MYFGVGTIHYNLYIPITKQFQKDLRAQKCFNNNNNNNKKYMDEACSRGHARLLGYLPGVHKALCLIPITA